MRKRVKLSPSIVAEMSDEELLDQRLCDLNLTIKGGVLEERIQIALRELHERELDFKPHFWLSDEWFCADGVPGVAIPFYLAHPRLERLERAQLFEVEGGDQAWCLRILRHELGHAIENAYRIRRLSERRKLFGKSSTPYPEFYSPRPYSKSFVLHLDPWYAQSHPDEDFAETFAVWLTPNSEWRERYADWPALRKLEYVDALMRSLRGKKPPVKNKKIVDPLSKQTKTLRDHYSVRKKRYGTEHASFCDKDLRILFSAAPQFLSNPTAASLIRRRRKVIRATVSRWTGAYQYTTDQVLDAIVRRCSELNLRLTSPEEVALKEFIVLLTVQTMNYLHSGRHRIAL